MSRDEASLIGDYLRRLTAALSAGVTSWTSFEALKEPYLDWDAVPGPTLDSFATSAPLL
ncbi:hypothetical protein OCU04_012533 [Sclerotinia nivalis]|uniref:Uncharacterized protein n=1 Tax=Sclerotinia nivalis TaxID=352851 RepID=A0A9X0A8V5_9HELO|nr:hypothetical protein OCU04_012533 [Sclerotinia nivalis]